MTIDIDIGSLADILRDAAAREIAPRFRNMQVDEIGQKSSVVDLVTQADLGAERVITEALVSRYPGAVIVGEEGYAADPAILSGLADAELAFVIDPVDGTFNFASGNGLFGSILAVVRRGETIAGLIADPMLGDVLMAEKGAGARLQRRDGRSTSIRAAPAVPLGDMVSVISWSYMKAPLRSQVAANLSKARLAMSYGCSAYEYWMMASGRAHIAAAQTMMPWDHLAGTLIHQEAGGYCARFDGSPYWVGQIDGGILSAPDKESWELIRREIIGG